MYGTICGGVQCVDLFQCTILSHLTHASLVHLQSQRLSVHGCKHQQRVKVAANFAVSCFSSFRLLNRDTSTSLSGLGSSGWVADLDTLARQLELR